jgi:hypothetical protein
MMTDFTLEVEMCGYAPPEVWAMQRLKQSVAGFVECPRADGGTEAVPCGSVFSEDS